MFLLFVSIEGYDIFGRGFELEKDAQEWGVNWLVENNVSGFAYCDADMTAQDALKEFQDNILRTREHFHIYPLHCEGCESAEEILVAEEWERVEQERKEREDRESLEG